MPFAVKQLHKDYELTLQCLRAESASTASCHANLTFELPYKKRYKTRFVQSVPYI